MSNLTNERKISEYAVNCTRYQREFKVSSNTTIYKGSMVCLNAQGFAVNAQNMAGLSQVIGIAMHHGNADEIIKVQTGFFAMNNDTLSPVTLAKIDSVVYVKDDNTISSSAGTNSTIAGKFRFIDTASSQLVVELGNA